VGKLGIYIYVSVFKSLGGHGENMIVSGRIWTVEVLVIVFVNFCTLHVLYRILIFPSESSFPLEFSDPDSITHFSKGVPYPLSLKKP